MESSKIIVQTEHDLTEVDKRFLAEQYPDLEIIEVVGPVQATRQDVEIEIALDDKITHLGVHITPELHGMFSRHLSEHSLAPNHRVVGQYYIIELDDAA